MNRIIGGTSGAIALVACGTKLKETEVLAIAISFAGLISIIWGLTLALQLLLGFVLISVN